jgi:hypothetical protein
LILLISSDSQFKPPPRVTIAIASIPVRVAGGSSGQAFTIAVKSALYESIYRQARRNLRRLAAKHANFQDILG